MTTTETVTLCWTIGEMAGLPLGTRIATNHNKLLELDESGFGPYWIEPGTLEPFYSPLVSWLPVVILPPVVEEGPDAA